MSVQFEFFSGVLSLLKGVMGGECSGCLAERPEPECFQNPVSHCVQENLGSLVISHFADGTVRKENIDSGVVQEEHADGGLTVRLPDGKVFQQHFDGAPLLVSDLDNPGPPCMGRVLHAHIGEGQGLVYHYEDPQAGHYVVELSTLRHFLGRRPPIAVAGTAPQGADWAWV